MISSHNFKIKHKFPCHKDVQEHILAIMKGTQMYAKNLELGIEKRPFGTSLTHAVLLSSLIGQENWGREPRGQFSQLLIFVHHNCKHW
jgi:hypothetical protein